MEFFFPLAIVFHKSTACAFKFLEGGRVESNVGERVSVTEQDVEVIEELVDELFLRLNKRVHGEFLGCVEEIMLFLERVKAMVVDEAE